MVLGVWRDPNGSKMVLRVLEGSSGLIGDPQGFEGSCKTFGGIMGLEGFSKDRKVIEGSHRIQDEFNWFRRVLTDLWKVEWSLRDLTYLGTECIRYVEAKNPLG